MKRYIFQFLLLVSVFCGLSAVGEAQVSVRSVPVKSGGTLPATCSPVARGTLLFYKTGVGNGLHYCESTDTWALVASAGGSGTVTSVGLSFPPIFNLSGTPVTTSGTLTGTLASQSQNLFFASPNGSAGAPTFRGVVSADLPNLDAAKITTGVFPVARLGTGTPDGTKFLRDDGTFVVPSGGGGLANVIEDLTPQLGGSLDVNGQSIVSVAAGNIPITPDTTGKIILDGLSWPTADGSVNQVLKTDGGGNLSFATPAGGGLANVIEDVTPQLGGSLDVAGQSIVSVAAGNILLTPDTSGAVIIDGLSYPQVDGTTGQFVKTDGAGNLTFATPAGGGNVSNTGTPLDNQVAIFTTATTVEGVAGLTYNGATLTATGGDFTSTLKIPVAATLPITNAKGDFFGTTDTISRLYYGTATDVFSEIPTANTAGSSANQVLGLNAANTGFETKTVTAGTLLNVAHAPNAVTIGLANGTAGNVITYGTGGIAEAVATGTVGQVLTSAGAGAVPTFSSAATGVTSLGTLTALQVDNVNINGNTISSTAGNLSMSGATGITLTPAAGSPVTLDTTMTFDGGVAKGIFTFTTTAGDELIVFNDPPSAADYFNIAPGTGSASLLAAGDSANVGINITPKAAGDLNLDGLKWPQADGTVGQFLKTDGAAQLAWATPGGSGDALVANPLSQFAATTSLQLSGVVSDETGTGAAVFGTSPDFTTGATIGGVAIPTISSTSTLTNKRINKRVVTTTDDATAVIDVDLTDVYELSAVATATEFTLTGTPSDGQQIIIRFKDAGVTKALTWTGFTVVGGTLPTTTSVSKWHYIGIIYNLAATQWHVISTVTQP